VLHRVEKITVNEMNLGNHFLLCTFAITVYFNLKKYILWIRKSLVSEASDFLFGQNSSFYEKRR